MELHVLREAPTADGSIFGRLEWAGAFQCWTLEAQHAVIPAGRYPIRITISQRFGRMLPLIDHVPQRAGIRIHPGNTEADTEGCILVGQERSVDGIHLSRAAMEALQSKIAVVLASGGNVWITIENAGPAHALNG